MVAQGPRESGPTPVTDVDLASGGAVFSEMARRSFGVCDPLTPRAAPGFPPAAEAATAVDEDVPADGEVATGTGVVALAGAAPFSIAVLNSKASYVCNNNPAL